MPVIFQLSKNEIRIIVWGAICKLISDWETSIDEMVFNEQIATGSFRGRFPVDDELCAIMQQMQAQGHIAPYYGVGGSRGACVYQLHRIGSGYSIHVKNTVALESTEFVDPTAGVPREGLIPQIQTWIATKLSIGEGVKPQLIFKINGKELQNLRAWAHWNERQAATSRYIYEFGRVAMGHLGFTVQVTDTLNNEQINVTDYASW